jgi:hypothetical protein
LGWKNSVSGGFEDRKRRRAAWLGAVAVGPEVCAPSDVPLTHGSFVARDLGFDHLGSPVGGTHGCVGQWLCDRGGTDPRGCV